MKTKTAKEADENFGTLIDKVIETREPVRITGERGNAMLICEQEWHSVHESLALHAIPGFVESAKKARTAGLADASAELDW